MAAPLCDLRGLRIAPGDRFRFLAGLKLFDRGLRPERPAFLPHLLHALVNTMFIWSPASGQGRAVRPTVAPLLAVKAQKERLWSGSGLRRLMEPLGRWELGL